MNRKAKFALFGVLSVLVGVVCFSLFVLVFFKNAGRISGPTASTTGKVISYERGTGTRTSRQSDKCTYVYRVGEKGYTIRDTCGGVYADREGGEAEIIYDLEDPQNAYVNRQGFFNFLGLLSIPIIISGVFLIRKAIRMDNDE